MIDVVFRGRLFVPNDGATTLGAIMNTVLKTYT